jgi:RNA polymerase sigma factor (sigma-70 family)
VGPTTTGASAGELVRRARSGDETAWSHLVSHCGDLLWSIARSYGLDRSAADDVVQIVWLRLVERIDTLRDPDAVIGWLVTTTRREAARALARVNPPFPVVGLADPVPGPEHVTTARDTLSEVARALRTMPPRCRNLLRLLALQTLTHTEIAAILRIPVGSVAPTRSRCLAALTRLLPDPEDR